MKKGWVCGDAMAATALLPARNWTTDSVLKYAKKHRPGSPNVTQLQLYQWCANHCVFRLDEVKKFKHLEKNHFPAVVWGNRTGDMIIRDMYLDDNDEVQVVVSTLRTSSTHIVPVRDVTTPREVTSFMARTSENSKGLALLSAFLRLRKKDMLVMVGASDPSFDNFGTGRVGFPAPSYQIVGQLAVVPAATAQTLSIIPYIVAGHFQEVDTDRVIKVDIRGLDKVRVADGKDDGDLEAIAKAIGGAYDRLAGISEFPDAEFTIEVLAGNEIITMKSSSIGGTQEFTGGIHELRTGDSAVNTILQTGPGEEYAALMTSNPLARSFLDTTDDLLTPYRDFQSKLRKLDFVGLKGLVEAYDAVGKRLFPVEAEPLPTPPTPEEVPPPEEVSPPPPEEVFPTVPDTDPDDPTRVSEDVAELERQLEKCRAFEKNLQDALAITHLNLERRTQEVEDLRNLLGQREDDNADLLREIRDLRLEPRPEPRRPSPPKSRKKDPARLAVLRDRVKELAPKLMALEKRANRFYPDAKVVAEAEAARQQMDALTSEIYSIL